MKSVIKLVCIVSCLGIIFCTRLWAQWKEEPYVDAYSSASDTKTTLTGPAFDAAAEALQEGSSDMASAAEAKAPEYTAKRGTIGNVMSTNPDGSVGISTISEWIYTHGSGTDTLKLQLTEGQNALNLTTVDHRGTLFVPDLTVNDKDVRYFVHFKVLDVDVLKYSDEAYDAGKFSRYYSGKPKKKSQYTLTCQVLSIEEVSNSVKLGFKMP